LNKLDALIETSIMRIEELYNDTNGKCVLSFSGGKDSTVLAELYLMAKELIAVESLLKVEVGLEK